MKATYGMCLPGRSTYRLDTQSFYCNPYVTEMVEKK